MHLSPRWLRLLSILRRWFCVVDVLFIVTPIVGVCNCSMFCCTLLYVHSSIVIILMGRRELVALLNLSSWCLVMVKWLFLGLPWGCLLFVIVAFPDHTQGFTPSWMFGGPWDSTLIMMGVPSLKMGVPPFLYKRWILGGSKSFREGIQTGLSCQTGVAKHQVIFASQPFVAT